MTRVNKNNRNKPRCENRPNDGIVHQPTVEGLGFIGGHFRRGFERAGSSPLVSQFEFGAARAV